MQQFLPGFVPVLPAQPVKSSFLKSETGANIVTATAETMVVEPENAGKKDEKASSFLKSEGQNGFNQLIDDDDESIKLNTESSSSIMNPKNEKTQVHPGAKVERVIEYEPEITRFEDAASFPTLEKILSSMDILFGDQLDPNMFADDLDPRLALAWICKAYFDAQRNPNFNNPVGLIRKRLVAKDKRKISRLDEMPAAYLEAIGLWEGRCDRCGSGFRSRAAQREHSLNCRNDPDQEDDRKTETCLGVDDYSIFPKWEQVLRLLEQELPRASFDTWVRDTRAAAWDSSKQTLVIGARNLYAADWLSNRSNIIQGYLFDLTEMQVTVEFKAVSE
jgi:hypothetical protein